MICLGNYSHTFGVIMICSRLKEWHDKKNQIIPVAILPLLLGTGEISKGDQTVGSAMPALDYNSAAVCFLSHLMCSPASTKKPLEATALRTIFVCNYLPFRVYACPFAPQSSVARSTKHPHLCTAAEKISRMPDANICSAGWLCSLAGLARCAVPLCPWTQRSKGA